LIYVSAKSTDRAHGMVMEPDTRMPMGEGANMSCDRVYDFIRGLEVRLRMAPFGSGPGTTNGAAPALNFLRPGQEARDLMRRHERMLLEMARPREPDSAQRPAPRADVGAPKPASKPAKPGGG
jgi:hypothetical protein